MTQGGQQDLDSLKDEIEDTDTVTPAHGGVFDAGHAEASAHHEAKLYQCCFSAKGVDVVCWYDVLIVTLLAACQPWGTCCVLCMPSGKSHEV